MRAHLFKRGDTNLYCLSNDRQGRAIPSERGGEGWRYIRPVELHPQEQRLAPDSDAAIADLVQRGYHFVHGWYHQQ
jgi:hypothetical protein